MKSHFFAYISRMRFIQRWALMRNTAPENVQEHSHQVAVLAHALAVIRNEKFGGRLDPGAVAVAALYHDASEILTGDMPTPIKYDNPAIRNAYKDVEAVAEGKLLHMLPPELQGVYGPILTQSDPEVRQVVKAADKLSAYIKCVEELKAGNNEFRQAAGQTRKALEGYELPEVTYFLETFMDSFSLTLYMLNFLQIPTLPTYVGLALTLFFVDLLVAKFHLNYLALLKQFLVRFELSLSFPDFLISLN